MLARVPPETRLAASLQGSKLRPLKGLLSAFSVAFWAPGVLGGGLRTADPLWWKRNTAADFYTYHLYPIGSTSPQCDYGAAVDVLTRYGRMVGPCFLGESSGDEFSRAGEPEEVGDVVVFLCSGEVDVINGATLEMDGGMLPGVLYEPGIQPIRELLEGAGLPSRRSED